MQLTHKMTMKALVVDNNPVVLRAISSILEKEGCKVESAPNGLEALNVLKSYTPDVVFTDLVMPHVDGEQLCKIIRNNNVLRKSFLVIISGVEADEISTVIDQEYYDLWIAKGTITEMRKHIRGALRSIGKEPASIGDFDGVGNGDLKDRLPATLTQELLTEKRHLDCILENLVEGIVEVNTSGVVVSINSAAKRILHVGEEDILGTNLIQYGWGEKQAFITSWVQESLPDPSGEVLEIHEDSPIVSGEYILTASFIPVRHERVSFGLCIFRDITRQHLAEEHERQLDNAIKLVTKMEAMSCMAGGIAHDFNNMLTVICGNLDILSHVGTQSIPEEQINLIEHARNAAYMAVDLTRKISHSSPFGIVTRQQYSLESIVEDSVDRFVKDTLTQVTFDNTASGAIVSVNPDQISAAIVNILQNAVEAGGCEKVQVVVSEENFPGPVIFSGQYVPAGTYACISVKDFGCGIEPVNLLKVFDPYFSTKVRGASKGIGLGLAVVYSTIRNHGGYVIVESEVGVETRVSCYLPCYGHKEHDEGSMFSGDRKKCSILLIDNDMQSLEVGRIMLEYIGYEVILANSLQDGCTTLKTRQLEGQSPVGVVMVDASQEPAGENSTVISLRREQKNAMKIIVVSGSLLDPLMNDCQAFGYAAALPKPFTLDSLKHVLMTAGV